MPSSSIVTESSEMYRLAVGSHTTVAAADSVTTGLREVTYAVACFGSDLAADALWVTAAVPSQISSPGVITVNTFQPGGAADSTPEAASAFSKTVYWMAMGR